MKEFLGIGGYTRDAEGYLSWQHLAFVTALVAVMALLAVFLGRKYKTADETRKNRVLVWAALLIDGFELFKITVFCIRGDGISEVLYNLPLFLCSIQLITIPLAAFSKGRVKEASLDFVCIFGLLGAILGTYAAGNNYAAYPVLSLDNVVSGITHCISGFVALYIFISGMTGMKKDNMVITFGILLVFCMAAYLVNIHSDCNYMFLMRGDGTPYDILYNLTGGHRAFYPLSVVALFLIYIVGFYKVYYLVAGRKKQPAV